jgi:heat shock protein HslJ
VDACERRGRARGRRPDPAPRGGERLGFGGCNTFTGGYELDGDGISIGPLAGALMASEVQKMAVEGAYMPALEAADAWSIDGDELVLSSGDEETLRFSGPG